MTDLEAEMWVNEMMASEHEADLLRAYQSGKLVGENRVWRYTLKAVAVALLAGFFFGFIVGRLWK